jgi:hypothetical protein
MHFKSGEKKAKATLEIGEKTYQIMPPSVGEATSLAEAVDALTGKPMEQSKVMKDFICSLGKIPLDELNTIENELFNDLFDYVIQPVKKK